MSFPERVDFKLLKEVVEDRLLGYDRFRQRVVESKIPFGRPQLGGRPELRPPRAPLPHRAARAGGQGRAAGDGQHADEHPARLHQAAVAVQFIENYRGGCALVARIHHCIADGIALVRVMLGMTDDTPGTPSAVKPATRAGGNGARRRRLDARDRQRRSPLHAQADRHPGGGRHGEPPGQGRRAGGRWAQRGRRPRPARDHAAGPADGVQAARSTPPSGAPGPRSCPSSRSRPSARPPGQRSTTSSSPGSPVRCAATSSVAAATRAASTSGP